MNYESVADEIIELARDGRGIRMTLICALKEAAGEHTSSAVVEDEEGWEWAVVEVFGHRRHAGRTREEERFGAKMLRIDVPNKGDPATHG